MFLNDPSAAYREALASLGAGSADAAAPVLRELDRRWPGRSEIRYPLGIACVQLGRATVEEGKQALQGACRSQPQLLHSLMQQGSVFLAARMSLAATAAFEVLVAEKPQDPEPWNMLGIALNQGGRFDQAVAAFERCLALQPTLDVAWANLGNSLFRIGERKRAMQCYDQSLLLSPQNVETRWNRSLCLLAMGRFSEGFAEFEVRWLRKQHELFMERSIHALPRWSGSEEIAGRTILLYSEQGLGDCLQFVRYAQLVRARGARVKIEVPAPLKNLIAHSPVGDHCEVIANGEEPGRIDFQCPLMSLPLALRANPTEDRWSQPYLRANAGRIAAWMSRLGPTKRIQMGLIWAGGASDALRDVPLAKLNPLTELDIDLLGLQLALQPGDAAVLPTWPTMRWLGDTMADFDDTAALMVLCDVIVTVDTASAHLAGALGRRTLLMLQMGADWRWLEDNADTPWYPTVTIYRQQRFGQWEPVINEIAIALRQLVAGNPRNP